MKQLRVGLCLLGLFCTLAVSGQNEKFKALFIYNFTHYIEWPAWQEKNFVIAVLGDSPIITELENVAKIKTVGNKPIEVKRVSGPEQAFDAQILFIPASKRKMVSGAELALKGRNTLIITDEASDGFGINFVQTGVKQSFQISKNNIESHNLKVNSTLIALGSSVN